MSPAKPDFGAWSLPKRVVGVILAIAGAIGGLFGAYQAFAFVVDKWNDAHKETTEFDRTPQLGMEFWQGDEAAPMFSRDDEFDTVEVHLKPASFVMRFPKVDANTAVELCAWVDDSLFKVSPDMPADNLPCMRQGRGIADAEYASGRLYVSNEAKNYLIGNRLRPQGGDQDQVFFSKVAPAAGETKVAEHSLKDQKDPLFLVVYIDRKADRVMGLGEYETVELDF